MQPDLRVDRLVLLHGSQHENLVQYIAEDIAAVSPETVVEPHTISFDDAWDFEGSYRSCLILLRHSSFSRIAKTISFTSQLALMWRRYACSY